MKIKACFIFMLIAAFVFPTFIYAFDEQNIEIVVEKRDKLITICNKYLEYPRQWRAVAKVNRLSNPDLILPGQKLLIPVKLLKGVPLDAKVTFIKGDVQSRPKDAGVWRRLHLNDMVSKGDSIKTGNASAVEITFEDSAALILRSNTALEVRTSSRKGFVYAVRDFFLSTGRTSSRLKPATGTEPRFKIYTPSAVAAARGTEFGVSVDAMETTRTEVLQGAIGVDAMAVTVEVNKGEGTLVRKNEPPLRPRKLLLPPSPLVVETLYRAVPLVLSFEQVSGAASYRVMLARDREIRDLIVDDVFMPGQSVNIAAVDDGLYFLQTRSIDSNGLEGVPSEPVSIRVRTNPVPPVIEFPGGGVVFEGKTLKVKWMKVGDAVGYHIQIAQDSAFKSIVEEQTGLTGTEYSTSSLLLKTYYFRVSSIAKDGYEGVWSRVVGFALAVLPPAPLLERLQISEEEVNFRWRSAGGETTYHFQMASDSAFQHILVDRKVDRAEMTEKKPDAPGIYYVRASGISPEGHEGKFSSANSFEIK